MDFILEIALTGWIDPFLWYKSMSAIFIQKSKKQCVGAFLVHCVLLICKQMITNTTENPFIQIIIMVAIELYLILVTIFLFKGRLRNKLICVFVFCCILILTELVVIKSYAFISQINLEDILQNGMANLICGVLILFLKSIACYCLFGNEKVRQFCYCNKERIVFNVMITVILLGMLLRKFIHRRQSDMSILIDAVWLVFLWNAFCFVITLRKKDNHISELQTDISHSMERNELAEDIERFKYSYSVNMIIMKNMLYNQYYDELGNYMEEAFADVEKAVLLYNHANLAVRILISRFIQVAIDMRIPFRARILVTEFGMTDEDICSILQNLIKNGLEAAAKVPSDIAFVSLQVLFTDAGYEIICSNTCMGKADFTKTSKQDKQLHGFGVGIIDKIARKYSASVSREYLETEREGIGRVITSIRVFYNGEL